jgi:cytochrome c biogenesis protein CcmG/thiol:disulfide interchange protein DsbE
MVFLRDSVQHMRAIHILIMIVGIGCGGAPAGPHEGQQAPVFEATRMNGSKTALNDFRGRPTVMVFWASWCGPCRKEAPEVARVAKSYGPRIHMLGINAGEPMAAAKRAAGQMGITWPVVMDPDGSIQGKYQVTGIPLVLILDAEGRVRHRNNGIPSDIHRLLDGLLG